jgi:hypothetical protein
MLIFKILTQIITTGIVYKKGFKKADLSSFRDSQFGTFCFFGIQSFSFRHFILVPKLRLGMPETKLRKAKQSLGTRDSYCF